MRNLRNWLIVLFFGILAVMLWVTVRASLHENLIAAGARLWPDPWFQATLCDAYCGFLTFYAWVAYKERSWPSRIGWLVAIALLGNLAMSAYVLLKIWRLRDFSAEKLLLRQD